MKQKTLLETGYEYLLEFFEDYDYRKPKVPPDQLVYSNVPNVVGHQQRSFLLWWVLRVTEGKENPIVIDVGAGQAPTPKWAIGVDAVHGIHPVYGGIYKPTVQALGEKLPFKKDIADVIVSNHSIEHMDNFAGAFRTEWLRVLKQGGIIAIVTPDSSYGSPVDPSHTREWTPSDFFIEILLPLIEEERITVLEIDSFCNHFSWNLVVEKRK